jgi:hypothetical protein
VSGRVAAWSLWVQAVAGELPRLEQGVLGGMQGGAPKGPAERDAREAVVGVELIQRRLVLVGLAPERHRALRPVARSVQVLSARVGIVLVLMPAPVGKMDEQDGRAIGQGQQAAHDLLGRHQGLRHRGGVHDEQI